MIRKLIVAMVAAAMLVAMALPAFAQLELFNPAATNVGEQNAAQEQNAALEQNCINSINQEINQEANANVEQGVAVASPVTINQEQSAANVAYGNEQNNKCVAVIAQEQELEQDLEQEAVAFNWLEFALGGGGGAPAAGQ